MNETEDWKDWSSCEMYGHYFVDGHCIDCGEDYDEDSLLLLN